MTLEQHLAFNRANIARDAAALLKNYPEHYKGDKQKALRDAADEYRQGFCEGMEAARYE